jgi:glutamyl/glutaminyl-tRNA synthetase
MNFLLENGHAYHAFDTKDELDALRANDQNFSYGHANRYAVEKFIGHAC